MPFAIEHNTKTTKSGLLRMQAIDRGKTIFYAGFPDGSLFAGRDIAERVNVTWGTFALVDATRALMRAALQDSANQKLVLLSESGIPLYPPDTLYAQLMSEPRSRINACVRPGVRASFPATPVLP